MPASPDRRPRAAPGMIRPPRIGKKPLLAPVEEDPPEREERDEAHASADMEMLPPVIGPATPGMEPAPLSLRDRDMVAWKAWKADPNDETMAAAINVLKPMIVKRVNQFATAPVPKAALTMAATRHAAEAIRSYDPSRGATLATHAFQRIQKVNMTVHKYQNVGRIPSHRIESIGDFKRAEEELQEEIGLRPKPEQILARLKDSSTKQWSLNEIKRIQSELHPDLIGSKNLELDLLPQRVSPRELDVARFLADEIEDKELRLVYEYSLGINGKPKLTAGEIAKKLKKNPPWVSRQRNAIDEMLQARGV